MAYDTLYGSQPFSGADWRPDAKWPGRYLNSPQAVVTTYRGAMTINEPNRPPMGIVHRANLRSTYERNELA